jgi:exodeoxyribonuclease VII small subunit
MKSQEAPPKNFESSLDALEKIVRELEQGDLPLEKSLELFEQGVRLSRECQERLNQAERRIEILLRDSEGKPAARTFAADEKSEPAEDLEANGDDAF